MKEILITSSVLILVILLAGRLFRGKVSQKLIYAAWLLVALRLLVPVQFGQFQFSVTTLTEQLEHQSEPIQQMQQALQEPAIGPSWTELYTQIATDYHQQHSEAASPEGGSTPSQSAQQLENRITRQLSAPTLSDVLTAVWIVGMSAMAAWFLTANFLFLHRAKKDAVPLDGYPAKVRIRISANVPTPCVAGFFRPTVYLTPAIAENEQRLHHVLTHELTHLRHLDPIWALVRCICLCIYWFDPLVWIAAGQSRRDCELACDESALKQLGDDQRIPYGKTLLDIVSESISPVHLLETPTAMNETKRQLKERVLFIADKKKHPLFIAVCLILICATVAGCTFAGAVDISGPQRQLITEVTRYDSSGNAYDQHIYTYDDLGRMICDQYVCPVEEIYLAYTRTYTYNDQGYLATKTNIHLNPSDPDYRHTYTYTYTDSGMVASCQWASGSGTQIYHYSYDDQNRLQTIAAESNSKKQTIVTCFYSEDGKLNTVQYQSKTLGDIEYAFGYDESGRLSQHLLWNHTYDMGGPIRYRVEFQYDDSGNLCTVVKDPPFDDPKWTFHYQGSKLTDIEYCKPNYNKDPEIWDYTLDSNSCVSSVEKSSGSRVTYRYRSVAGTETDPRYQYWNAANEAMNVIDYRDMILYYFLPRVELSGNSADNLY